VRPVNLIPPEDRRGDKAPMRTGPLAYVIVAALAVALVAVTLTVLTANKISDREAQKASLQSQLTQVQADAQRLQTFADFAALQQTREQTVSTLAQSRFDWPRVLRELAIVIPNDVWITNMTAKASAEATASSSSASSTSASGAADSVQGPSLDIQGCAGGHDAVARFLASLHDIDGVTRASVLSSDRPSSGNAGGTSGQSSGVAGSSQTCSSRAFISSFEIVIAFDAVQIGGVAGSATATPTSTASTPATATPSTQPAGSGTTASTGDQSQVAGGEQQLQQQKDSAASKTQKGRNAVSTFIPGTGSTP
jgi:Tfp pilus assembly protein PilN